MRTKKYMYILKEQGTQFYRVGSTHSVDFRESVLRQGNPRKLEIFHWEEFDEPKTVLSTERYVQRLMNKYSHTPSWYKVPKSNMTKIKEECVKIKKWYLLEKERARNYGFEFYMKFQPVQD